MHDVQPAMSLASTIIGQNRQNLIVADLMRTQLMIRRPRQLKAGGGEWQPNELRPWPKVAALRRG